MSDNAIKPPARALFRKLALALSIVCFALAAVFNFVPVAKGDRLFTVLICLFVGFVMLTIGRTGFWPRPKK